MAAMRTSARFLPGVLLLVLCATLTCSQSFAGTADPALRLGEASQATGDTSYRLGTGDKIRVIVFGEDDLGGEFQIDGSGFVRLPLIGQVTAAGLSAPELESRIAGQLGNGYLNAPRVSVEVIEYRPFYILGEINKPGQYAYVNDMNALNAIALAGGYTVKASDSTIYIRRDGTKDEQRLSADETTKIHPGDVIRVPPTAFWAAITYAGPLSAIISTRWYLPQPPQ
jgi:protein involved in polysaccharide export with SLBB domain